MTSPADGTVIDGAALDGNAAGGALTEVFGFDLTAATGRCAGCGTTGALARAQLYAHAPGMVVRCPGCQGVLIRLVTAPDRSWLDLRGLAYLQLARSA